MPDRPAVPSDPRVPRTLTALSWVHGIVGATRSGRGLLHALRIRRLARAWLRAAVLEQHRERPDTVTVLIGVRDRTDHRLALALRCIRAQTYPARLVQVIVIDYGSAPVAAELTARLCREHDAFYMRVDAHGVWSRSRCLNAGIRRVTTKYLLTSDADILLSPEYLAKAVTVLRRSPLSLVCAPMFDLPEHSAEVVRAAAENGSPLPLRQWKGWAAPRRDWEYHPSLIATYTIFHQVIRGYDEYYELWGSEDIDLWRRFTKLGLERQILDPAAAFYLHQWHPKYENTPEASREQAIRRNSEHYRKVQTIVRNGLGWGRGAESLICEYPSRSSGRAEPADA